MASFKSSSTLPFMFFLGLMLTVISSALDMSIIDYDRSHGLLGPFKRTEKDIKIMFESWLVKHHKNYNDIGEKEVRYQIFKDNLMFIDEHNAGNHSSTLGLNDFTDLTFEEFRSKYAGGVLEIPEEDIKDSTHEYETRNGSIAPNSVDWRTSGAIGVVRDQGSCQSCWAFCATAATSAIHVIKKKSKFIEVSVKQLVDCATSAHTPNCGPGWPTKALQWIVNNRGICKESDYPYKPVQDPCKQSTLNLRALSIDSYKTIRAGNADALKNVVADQPVIVAIEASKTVLKYKNGILEGPCGTAVNHAVLIIGYGTENGKDYWLIKNSWGTNWGDGGYGKIKRGSNTCGIESYIPSFPVLN